MAVKSSSKWIAADLGRRGWPVLQQVGRSSSCSTWLLDQHSTLEIQKLALPKMAAAVLSGNAPAVDLASRVDSGRLSSGETQLQGTSLMRTDEGCLTISSIDSAPEMERRRDELGRSLLLEWAEVTAATKP